jgi:hypothetical protein
VDVLFLESDKDDPLDPRAQLAVVQELLDALAGHLGGVGAGVAVDAGADAAKGHGPDAVLGGEGQASVVARREQRPGPLGARSVVDGTDGVDDVLGRQPVALGQLGIARGAADAAVGGAGVEVLGEPGARGPELPAGGAVDGAVDAAAAHQGGLGGVDDGLDGQGGDVGAQDGQALVVCCDGAGNGCWKRLVRWRDLVSRVQRRQGRNLRNENWIHDQDHFADGNKGNSVT